MTIDITPEAVERVASVCDTLGYHHAAATLRALFAALERSEESRLEALRRRDEWEAKAEGFEAVRLALREKVGAPWPPSLSRALWAGIAADEKARADTAETALTAYQAETAAVIEAVTVKPLDWARNQWNWLSYHFPYEIRCEGGIGYLVDYGGHTLDGKPGGPHDTLDQAKVAANADHSSRIMAAITTPADSKAALDRMIAEARKDGMREAARIAEKIEETLRQGYAATAANAVGEVYVAILAAIPKGKDHE